MEYFLCRSMEVCRLDDEELIRLHTKERNIGRGLAPFEIQEAFHKSTLREHYEIPDHDPSMSAHNQRLRKEFRAIGLYPKGGDFIMNNVGDLHTFDHAVRQADGDLKIDMKCRLSKQSHKRYSDELS